MISHRKTSIGLGGIASFVLSDFFSFVLCGCLLRFALVLSWSLKVVAVLPDALLSTLGLLNLLLDQLSLVLLFLWIVSESTVQYTRTVQTNGWLASKTKPN